MTPDPRTKVTDRLPTVTSCFQEPETPLGFVWKVLRRSKRKPGVYKEVTKRRFARRGDAQARADAVPAKLDPCIALEAMS